VYVCLPSAHNRNQISFLGVNFDKESIGAIAEVLSLFRVELSA